MLGITIMISKREKIMKYVIIISTFLLSILLAEDNTTQIKVDGMQCSYSCAGKVSSVVQNLKGVKECSVDFEKGIATVVYDDKQTMEKKIVEGLSKETSYTVSLLDKKKTSSKEKKI